MLGRASTNTRFLSAAPPESVYQEEKEEPQCPMTLRGAIF
jgi:hypothetical protein